MKFASRIAISIIFVLLLFGICCASAESGQTLRLSNNLEVIGEEAFCNATSISRVFVPDGTTEICSKAFAYSSLQEIDLPESIERIADDAFEGCTDFVVKTPVDCYAYNWCLEHGYEVVKYSSPAEDFTYEAINGLYAKITKYTGNDSIVVIPETIDDYIVQVIGTEAFFDNTSMECVVIPDTVTELGKQAFSFCHALETVDMGHGVTTLGNWVFYASNSLRRIDFPESVTTMGRGVLQNCENLEYVGYPINWNTANTTGEVFAGCPKLTEIVIPEGVTVIPNYAFANCPNLERIVLPEGLEYIYHHAFSNCTGLTEMVYPSTIKTVGGIDGCTSITSVVIPDGAETIGTNAFDSVPLESIVLPDSVTTINNYAFQNCASLKSVAFGAQLNSIGVYAFYKCSALTELILPDSVTSIGAYAFANCSALEEFGYPVNWTEVTRKDSSSSYGHNFDNCTKLRRIEIPEGATVIPRAAFAYATYLRSVSMPGTIKTVGEDAFRGCTAITSVQLPEGVKVIGASAFRECIYLSEVEFPSTLLGIDHFAFMGCSSLKEALLPDGMTTIATRVFADCISLETFKYPVSLNSTVRYPYDYRYEYGCTFLGCKKLKKVVIPEGVTSIPNGVFNQSNYIESIVFPSTLVNIDCFAFASCTSLKAAMLPDSLTSIGSQAFDNCVSLETVHYPKSLTTTTYYPYDYRYPYGCVFKGCTKLKQVEIPNEVHMIPRGLFRYAPSLEKVYLGYNITSIGDLAFDNCPNLTIWTEYGACALQYAKDNGISYYYLTPDGMNAPSGTLYKSDSFPIYGYARSSLPIANITATIWDSTGANVIQQASVDPQTTDYCLAGTVNSSLRFSELPLGSYRYTVTAETELSDEVWANNAFTVAPPPLRIYISGLSSPEGLIQLNAASDIAGVVVSNYSITSLRVTVYNSAGTAVMNYSVSPNSMTAALSNANSFVDISTLSPGEYSFVVNATANGISKDLVRTIFRLGDPNSNLSPDDIEKLVAFASVYSNVQTFDYSDYNSVLGSMGVDDIMLMAINSRNKMFVGKLMEWITGDNTYMVDLYKKEIISVLDSIDPSTDLIEADSSSMFILDSLQKYGKISVDYIKEGAELTSDMEVYIDSVNEYLSIVGVTFDLFKVAAEVGPTLSVWSRNYENGLLILKYIDEMSGNSGNADYQKAMQQLIAEYTSKSTRILGDVIDIALSKASGDFDKFVSIILGEAGTSGNVLYRVTTLSLDIAMQITGGKDVAENSMDFMVQVENFLNAQEAFRNSFSAVYKGNTSSTAVSRMSIAFEYAKQSAMRLYETMIKLTSGSEKAHLQDQLLEIENLSIL